MSVHQKKPDGRWYCTWRENGKKKFKYFGCDPSGEILARRYDDQVKRDKGKVPIVPGGLTVAEVLQRYHLLHPIEPTTGKSDSYRITAALLPLIGGIHCDALTSVELNRYVAIRLETGLKRRTVAREIDLLRAAMNWADSQDPPLIFRNATRKFRVPRGRESETPNPPGRLEVERLLAASPPHLARALILSWSMGLRPGGEVARLTWSDYNQEAKELRVVSARKGGPAVRFVPLPPNLDDTLNSWMASDVQNAPQNCDIGQTTIVHYRYQPVASIKRSWRSAKKKAGITRRLRPYDLRHAWFTNALKLGGDIKAISEIGGHSRVDTTLRFYDHVTQERHRSAMEKIQEVTSATILLQAASGNPKKALPDNNIQP
jgi:integrase